MSIYLTEKEQAVLSVIHDNNWAGAWTTVAEVVRALAPEMTTASVRGVFGTLTQKGVIECDKHDAEGGRVLEEGAVCVINGDTHYFWSDVMSKVDYDLWFNSFDTDYNDAV